MLAMFPALERKAFDLYERIPSAPARLLEKSAYHGLTAFTRYAGKYTVEEHNVNGQHFKILQTGDTDKPPLVWLHGFSDTIYSFALSARYLKAGFRLIIPTIPGFDDDLIDIHREFSLENYAQLFEALFNKILDEDFYLAGNSLGAAIALKLAIKNPQKIIKVFPVSSAAIVPDIHTGIYRELLQGENIFHINNVDEFNLFLRRIFHRPPNIPFILKAHLYHEFRKKGVWYNKIMTDLTHGLFGSIHEAENLDISRYTLDDQLESIDCKTHIVWGVYDPVFPIKTAQYMHRKIPGSQLTILPTCSHCPHIERPREFADLLLQK